jgi:hypothetical protein
LLDVANCKRAEALLREAQGREGDARHLWREAGELYRQAGADAGAAECAEHLAGDPCA